MIKLRMRRKLMRMAVVASPLPDSGRVPYLSCTMTAIMHVFYPDCSRVVVPVLDSHCLTLPSNRCWRRLSNKILEIRLTSLLPKNTCQIYTFRFTFSFTTGSIAKQKTVLIIVSFCWHFDAWLWQWYFKAGSPQLVWNIYSNPIIPFHSSLADTTGSWGRRMQLDLWS